MKQRFEELDLKNAEEYLSEDELIANLEELLEPGVTNQNGMNILHYAAHVGYLEIFRKLSNDYKERFIGLINEPGGKGSTPLHFATNSQAVEEKRNEITKILLENGANPNLINNDDRTPLHNACDNGYFNTVNLLLEDDRIDINVTDKNGNTALHYACEAGDANVIALLIKKGMDINVTNNEGKSAINLVENDLIKQVITKFFNDQISTHQEEVADPVIEVIIPPVEENKTDTSPKKRKKVSFKEPISASDEDYKDKSYTAKDTSRRRERSKEIEDDQESKETQSSGTKVYNSYPEFIKAQNLSNDRVLDAELYDTCRDLVKKLEFIQLDQTKIDKPPVTQIFGDQVQSHIAENINNSKFSYYPENYDGDDPAKITEVKIPRIDQNGNHLTNEFEVLHLNRDGDLLSFSVVNAAGEEIGTKFNSAGSQLDENWIKKITKNKSLQTQLGLDKKSAYNDRSLSSGAVVQSIDTEEKADTSKERAHVEKDLDEEKVIAVKKTIKRNSNTAELDEKTYSSRKKPRTEDNIQSFIDEYSSPGVVTSSAGELHDKLLLSLEYLENLEASRNALKKEISNFEGQISALEEEKTKLAASTKKTFSTFLQGTKLKLDDSHEVVNAYLIPLLHRKKKKTAEQYIGAYKEETRILSEKIREFEQKIQGSSSKNNNLDTKIALLTKIRNKLLFDQQVVSELKKEEAYYREANAINQAEGISYSSPNKLDEVYLRNANTIRRNLKIKTNDLNSLKSTDVQEMLFSDGIMSQIRIILNKIQSKSKDQGKIPLEEIENTANFIKARKEAYKVKQQMVQELSQHFKDNTPDAEGKPSQIKKSLRISGKF